MMALGWCASHIRAGFEHKPTSVIICAYGHLFIFCSAAWALSEPSAFDISNEIAESGASVFLARIIVPSLVVGGMMATLFLRPANWGRPWDVTLAQGLARSVLCGTLIVMINNILTVLGCAPLGVLTDISSGHEIAKMPLAWISRPAVRGLALDAVAIKANARGWLRLSLHATSWGFTLCNGMSQMQFPPVLWVRWCLSAVSIACGITQFLLVVLCVKKIDAPNDRRWAIALTVIYTSGLILLIVAARGSVGTLQLAALISCFVDATSVLSLSAFISTLHWLTENDTQRQLATTQAAFERQGTFLSYICHELRVPLQSIVLAAEDAYESSSLRGTDRVSESDTPATEIGDGGVAAASNRCNIISYDPLRIILTATEALSKLVDDFLSLSKIEAGKLVMELGSFDPRALIHDVLSQCASQLRRGQLTVTLELDSDVPLLAVSDAGRLRQILNNFTTNAMKFTPPGGSLVYRLRMVPVDRLVGMQFAAAFLPLHSSVTTTRHASPAFGCRSSSADDHPTAIRLGRPHNEGTSLVPPQTQTSFHLEIDASSSEVDGMCTEMPQPSAHDTNSQQGVTPCFTIHAHPPSVIVPVVSTTAAAGVGSTVDRTSPRNWQAGWNGPLAAPVPCMLVFEVQDSGVGIDVVDQEKLFKPFEQIKAGALQKGNGTGLGLSICKHIIQQLGGDIGCASSEGHGSRFWFSIPVSAVSPAVSSVPTPLARAVRTSLRPTTGAELLSMPARESRESIDQSVVDSAPAFRGAPPRKAAAVQQRTKLEVSQYSRRPPVPAITNHAALVIKCPSVALSAVPEVISDLTPIARPPQLNSPPGQISAGSSPSSPVSPVMHPPAMIPKAAGTMHAVVVDDTDVNRIMLARLLQRVGFGKVSTAIHGADALSQPELLSADAWLVDRNMPVMGGEELTVALRTRGYGGIIIGVSGDAIGEVGEGWKRAGLTCLLLKPVSRNDVEEALRAHGVL